jgi:hypothetical protein
MSHTGNHIDFTQSDPLCTSKIHFAQVRSTLHRSDPLCTGQIHFAQVRSTLHRSDPQSTPLHTARDSISKEAQSEPRYKVRIPTSQTGLPSNKSALLKLCTAPIHSTALIHSAARVARVTEAGSSCLGWHQASKAWTVPPIPFHIYMRVWGLLPVCCREGSRPIIVGMRSLAKHCNGVHSVGAPEASKDGIGRNSQI